MILKGLPFRGFSKTAERKFTKLSGQIDLDEWSKICHRLKTLRCFLLGNIGVTKVEND